MVKFTKGNSKMGRNMVMAHINGLQVIFMGEILWRISDRELEYTNGMKEVTTKANGLETE
jgi:hypothetical protein